MCTVNVELELPVTCRICKKNIYKRYSVDRERKLKHLPTFGIHTFIIYIPHRYICEDCQENPTTTATPLWHSQNGSHTIWNMKITY
jgi:hypothetical protein